MSTKAWAALLCLLAECQGCAPLLSGASHDATSGVVSDLTSPATEKRLGVLAATATSAARDEALGPKTQAEASALVAALDPEVQKLVAHTGAGARAQVDALVAGLVETRVRQAVRIAIDEALSPATELEADDLREQLLGAPLQKDVNAAIDSASPHLASAVAAAVKAGLAPVNADASRQEAKWEPIAVGLGVGVGLFFVCLLLAAWVIHTHHGVIAALMKERDETRKA